MTSDQQRQFEHMWPALSARLHRLLSRKKVSPWLAEDLVQETGLRLIRMWPEIDQAKPIWPLTATIALNLFRDELRRAGGKESVQTLPDSPSSENVEERGMARVELRAVGGALAQMPAPQRDAILADLSAGAAAPPLASSARMLRMRARRRLQHLMDHASVLGVALGVQMRRAVRELELVMSRVLPQDAERVTAAAISLLAAISFGVAVSPSSTGRADVAAGVADAATRPGEATVTTGSPTSAGFSIPAASDRTDAFGSGQPTGGRSTDPRALKRAGDGTEGTEEMEPQDFPGSLNYALRVTDDTYVRGALGADVFAGGDPNKARNELSRSPGQFNCTVAPSHTGASCMASDDGSEYTGVRAEHQGEARVAGRRIL